MVFDTAAGETSPWLYRTHVVPQLEKMFSAFPQKLGYYSQKTGPDHLSVLWQKGLVAGMGYDHRWELTPLFSQQPHGFIQGNFDQTMLFAEADVFKSYLQEFLRPLLDLTPEQRAGWVCGLGHGVLPKTPEDNVRTFVSTVREVFGG